jgi:transposase-like protein
VLSWGFGESPPRARREYPRDLAGVSRWFGSEANAVRYRTAVRFRSGIAFPRCGMTIPQPGRPRWWCGACRRWFAVTTGTIPECTKWPVMTRLVVAWHLVQTKIGVSALSVQQITGINYVTAWLLLQKMRAAVDQGER